MSTSEPHLLPTLGVALLFAAIFLLGGRAATVAGRISRRRFLSFAAGVSVAYTFVHVLPALHLIREFQTQAPSHSMVFPEHGVYLWTMAGFLVFFGLQAMIAPEGVVNAPGVHTASLPSPRPRLQIAGFALYTLMLAYMMVWTAKDGVALGLFALAMGLHLSTIASNLSSHCREAYRPRGALLLAAASLAGWGAAATLKIPAAWVLNLVAFVIGGVIVNAAIAELPKEGEASYGSFVAGAASYTALLLTLSKFEATP